MLVTMPIRFVLTAINGPAVDRPKFAVLLLGAAISATLVAWRIFRTRAKRSRPARRALRPWLRPLDYVYGVAIYLGLIIGCAQAAAEMSPSDYGGRIGLFVAIFALNQLSARSCSRSSIEQCAMTM
jgi:hypothetical protein